MSRFCPLFSGSKGNCVAVGSADSFILIDAGVSAKRIVTALGERGLDPARLTGIFVTHEHTDHISGLRVLASKYNLPVFATAGTLGALERSGALVGTGGGLVCPPQGMEHHGLRVTPFHTMHDTAESCGYTVELPDGRRAAVATDTGCVTEAMRAALLGCDLVYIESNHDVAMLMGGSYSPPLKQRILSPSGHLSNEACAAELPYLAQNGTTRFLLAHISQENNTQAKAAAVSRAALSAAQLNEGRDFLLSAVPPDGLPMMIF